MKCFLLSLCLVFLSGWFPTLCHGQMERGRMSCLLVNFTNGTESSNSDGVIDMCERFYGDGDHYFSGSPLNGFTQVFSRIHSAFLMERNNQCIDLMENYLCYYYFPLCNPDNNEIIPVCSRSCVLLRNNRDCHHLRMIAAGELANNSVVPPDDACAVNYHSYVDSVAVILSESCYSIEDTLMNITLPLTCIETTNSTPCSSLLQQSFHAPRIFPSATLELISQMMTSRLDFNSTCSRFIIGISCFLFFAPCNPITGKVLPLCTDSAVGLSGDALIRECFNTDDSVLNQTLSNFDGLDPKMYYNIPVQYIETDQSQCVLNDISSIDEDIDGGDFTAGAIVGSVLGAFFVLIIVVIILVLFVRQKKVKRAIRKHRFTKENNISLDITRIVTTSTEPSPELMHGRINGSSVLLEMKHLLDDVKHRFSQVLLPVDSITKQQGLLGKGAFGVVHRGEIVSSDGIITAVAIKTIKFGTLDAMKDLIAESSIMKTFHHPNVLPLLGVCIDYDDDDVLKIIIPFMTNGDLKNFLKDSRVSPNNTHEYPKNLSEEILMKMCFDIAKGMEYLAQKRFIHRDLAARNCMVDTSLIIKIADFGLAKDVYTTEYYRVEKHTTLPVKWMAIESLLDGYFDEKTDVWSYGITCWEIFSLGRIPYPGVDNANVTTLLKNGTRLPQPELCPTKMNELITSTWLENSDDRPTFTMIVQKLSGIYNLTKLTDVKDT